MDDGKYKFNGDSVGEWFKFSRNVRRQARALYGDIGAAIWANNAPRIDAETVDTVAQDVYWEIERKNGRKAADNYWDWDYFWTVDYQRKWRNDALGKIVDYVESVSDGKALKFMAELEDDEKPQLQALMQRKFGGGTSSEVSVLEKEFDAGLPQKGEVAFPKGCDMKQRLHELEERRLALWMMAPESARKTYKYGKPEHLVRILIKHLNSEYMGDVNNMLALHKVELKIAGHEVPEDLEIMNYDDEWLPPYKKLQQTIMKTYHTLKKDVEDEGATQQLPNMAITGGRGGDEVKGKGRKRGACWDCGQIGHHAGDPDCRSPDKSKGPAICRDYARTGYCRYGERCKFKHIDRDQQRKGGASDTDEDSTIAKITKAVLKKLAAQMAKNRDDKETNHSSDDDDERESAKKKGKYSSDDLYNLLIKGCS